jgi:AcrR family transcriptional regulator
MPRGGKSRKAVDPDTVTVAAVDGREVDELAKTREAAGAPRLALLDAGTSVITDIGFARATVEAISERAGVATDVFYAHFQGKGALLRALSDRFVEQMIASIDEETKPGLWKGASAREFMYVAVKSVIETVLNRQGLVRALLAHGTTDVSLAAGLRKIGIYLVDRMMQSFPECGRASTSHGKS